MATTHHPLLSKIMQHVPGGNVFDVYEIVEAIAPEFRGVPRSTLERIVSEEVVRAHGNAFWGRRR